MGLLGPVVGRLYDRFGARAPLMPGTVVTSLALWSTTLFGVDSPGLLIVFHLLLSVGLAFAFTPLFTAGLGALAAPRLLRQRDLRRHPAAGGRGRGRGAGQRAQRAGGGAGRVPAAARRVAGGVHAAFLVAAGLSVVAVIGSLFVRTPELDPAAGLPPAH